MLPLDREGAERAAELGAHALRSRHTFDMGDVLIDGIARADTLTVATRNVADFGPIKVEVINPWETQ